MVDNIVIGKPIVDIKELVGENGTQNTLTMKATKYKEDYYEKSRI